MWEPFKVSLMSLCSCDEDRKLKVGNVLELWLQKSQSVSQKLHDQRDSAGVRKQGRTLKIHHFDLYMDFLWVYLGYMNELLHVKSSKQCLYVCVRHSA